MTDIRAIIKTPNGVGSDADYGMVTKRFEVEYDGPVASWKLYFDNSVNASQFTDCGATADIYIDNNIVMKGYVEDILPDETDPKVVLNKYAGLEGRNGGRDLTRLLLMPDSAFVDARMGDIFNLSLLYTESKITADPQLVAYGNEIISLLEPNDRSLLDLYNDNVSYFVIDYSDFYLQEPVQIVAYNFFYYTFLLQYHNYLQHQHMLLKF